MVAPGSPSTGQTGSPEPHAAGSMTLAPRTMARSCFWLACHWLSRQRKVHCYFLRKISRWTCVNWIVNRDTAGSGFLGCSRIDFKNTHADRHPCTNRFWPHVQALDLHNTRKSDART